MVDVHVLLSLQCSRPSLEPVHEELASLTCGFEPGMWLECLSVWHVILQADAVLEPLPVRMQRS